MSWGELNKLVVYQVKDTIFWKQITTPENIAMYYRMLFIKSKIQFFESKSQLNVLEHVSLLSCLSSQRYNFLKANHNLSRKGRIRTNVVYQVKDTIFWKQITTIFSSYNQRFQLFIKSKIQFFESKSQPYIKCCSCRRSCLSSQRYNFLKANHNYSNSLQGVSKLFIKSKIQFFESKSQLNLVILPYIPVVYQVKDTIFWKQITTTIERLLFGKQLFIK